MKTIIATIMCFATLAAAPAHAQQLQPTRLPAPVISEAPMAGYQTVSIEGANIAYVERVQGHPIIFLHGNPSSSYLFGWYTERMGNLETAYVGQGLHFIQEDQSVAIGRAVSDWLRRR